MVNGLHNNHDSRDSEILRLVDRFGESKILGSKVAKRAFLGVVALAGLGFGLQMCDPGEAEPAPVSFPIDSEAQR